MRQHNHWLLLKLLTMGYALWILEINTCDCDMWWASFTKTMKIKPACLRNSAIHPRVIWWIDCMVVTTAWRWVTSTQLQQLLILGVAEKGLRRWGETFPRLEESREDDIPTPWHSQLCMNCCRDFRQRCCPKERPRELPPPTCKLTARPDGCSHSAALGLSYAPLSPLETWGCAPDLPWGWTQPPVARQQGEGGQSHRLRSSKVIRQTHYGNN